MNALLTPTARLGRRAAPLSVAVAVAALSVGAYSGDAHVSADAAGRANLNLVLTRRVVTLTPGSSVRVSIVIHRRHMTGVVKLAILSKLPRGLTARFAPARARGKRSVLTLRAALRLRPGRYAVILRGTGRHARRRTELFVNILRRATTVTPAGTANASTGSGSGTAEAGVAFAISGDAAQVLAPGVSQPIDLKIHNPNSTSLTLSTLTALVSGVDAPKATPTLPCTPADFSVQPYSGALPLVIAPSSTISLQQLGVPESEWPQVSMLDRPTNQDGCGGASLSLSYGAAASVG